MNIEPVGELEITCESRRPAEGGGLFISGERITVELNSPAKKYLVHGWQSWSLTTWLDASLHLPVMRPTSLHPMQTDPVTVRDARPNGSWYGAVELENGQIVFLGALGLEAHVALDGKKLTGRYEEGNGEWFCKTGEETRIFQEYARLLKEKLGSGRIEKPPKVWCSWYSLYTEIHEQQLVKILGDLGNLPFDVFQIDDGWQKGIGDWEANEKFPSGMDGLAAKIRQTGRKAGLWLAPFLVTPSSSIYKQHKDWLLHDEKGRFVSAGHNWSAQLYALDTTQPEALEWLAALMKKVRAWGYDYVKLDFLYAGALPGKRHLPMPREAAYRHGLKAIREALGEAYFLTCGAPILPSLGLCDGIRVGPDVAGYWTSKRDNDYLQNYTTPGGQNALRTTLHRLWLQPIVHTDPDVVYFGSFRNTLTSEQKRLLQDLAAAAGFKATSDIPAWLNGPERACLDEYLLHTEPVEQVGQHRYRIGGREVDFNPFIEMPKQPGALDNAWGAVLDALAGAPALMRIFERIDRWMLRKKIEANPL